MAARVAKLVVGMYNRQRHVKVRGAVAKPRKGNHGLDAGCALTQDMLKAFRGTVKHRSVQKASRDTMSMTFPCR